MNKKRFVDIDFLRGAAIIIIIITHVYGLHLGNARDFTIWNWLHFVVPGFLFCSGFVLASQSVKFTSVRSIARWMGKRFSRLLIPYYIYFSVHFLLFLLFPAIFSNFHFKNSFEFIFGSLFFTGAGVSHSWLPMLFIELTLLFPVVVFLHKKGLLFYFKSLILISIVLLTWSGSSIPAQQLTHWFFWLYPLILGYLFSGIDDIQRKNLYILGSILSLGIFIFLFMLLSLTNQSLVLTHHKYPPDLFYLTYALGLEFLLLFTSGMFLKFGFIKKTVLFFSKNSYRSFFVHYIVLDVVFSLTQNMKVVGSAAFQSILVIALTVILLFIWDKSKYIIASKPKLSYK